MSEATDAKSAEARATIAICKIKRRQTSGRSFSDCFEMGDGDDVIREILRRSENDPEIENCYPHVAQWRKTFDNSFGRGYHPLPPQLASLGTFCEALHPAKLISHTVFVDDAIHTLTIKVDLRFSIMNIEE